jgi:hypothetical protein
MPYLNPPNRSQEYRKQAEEARIRAAAAESDSARDALLQVADTWERMARWEDANNPPHPSVPNWRPEGSGRQPAQQQEQQQPQAKPAQSAPDDSDKE